MPSGRTRPGTLAAMLTLALALVGSTSVPTSAAAPARHLKAERLALSLLNCTRTGGWVKKSGRCVARGTGKHSAWRRPLERHKPISKRVAWPWAAQLVTAGVCDHTLPGEPDLGQRLRAAGFRHTTYGENIGCGWGLSAREMVIRTHRGMQAEKAYGGGHWRNMKDRAYRSVGIGVARFGDMTAVVYDFYGKRAP